MSLNFNISAPEKKEFVKFKLSLKEVVNAALENWDRLGCNNNKTQCVYFYEDGKDTRCVIGISMNDEHKKFLIKTNKNNNWSVTQLSEQFDFGIDLLELQNLQFLHDEACYKDVSISIDLKQKLEELKKTL